MSRSRKEYITVRLNGKILLAIALYTTAMMAIGAGIKSCQHNARQVQAKITNIRTR